MSYRTLAELESDIRYRYDIESMTDRHPQANIFRLINDAMRSLRDRLTSSGSTLFLTTTEASQTTTGATSGYPGTLLSSTFGSWAFVREVHVKIGTTYASLMHREFTDALTRFDGVSTGVPESWSMAGISNVGSPLTGQTANILITPALDVARIFRIIGVASWLDLSTGTDRIATDLGFHEYIVAAVGCDLALRDDDAKLHPVRFAERERIYADIKSRSLRREPTGVQRVDVRRRGW